MPTAGVMQVRMPKRRSGAVTAACGALLAAGLLGLASPAHAQFSEGYRFLEAVKKKEGDKVETLLGEPGSTVILSRDVSTGRGAIHIVTERRDIVCRGAWFWHERGFPRTDLAGHRQHGAGDRHRDHGRQDCTGGRRLRQRARHRHRRQ